MVGGKCRKDLTLISRLLPEHRRGLVLVDDNAQSVLMNHPNAVEVDCFEG